MYRERYDSGGVDAIDSQCSLPQVSEPPAKRSADANLRLPVYGDGGVCLARAQNVFALRILLLYSCFAIYCDFYMLNHNIRVQYVNWSVHGHTMCALDTGLVQHVHRKRFCSDFTRLSWLLHRLDLRRDKASGRVDCKNIWLSYAVIDLLL